MFCALLRFLVSPLELESSFAEPGGVTSATSGGGWSSFSLSAGLFAFAGPLVLLPAFVAE